MPKLASQGTKERFQKFGKNSGTTRQAHGKAIERIQLIFPNKFQIFSIVRCNGDGVVGILEVNGGHVTARSHELDGRL